MLHSALVAPCICDDWSGDEADWNARIIFNTEDDCHEKDHDGESLDPRPLLDDRVKYLCHEADEAADEYSIDYIFCEDEDGTVEMIRNPMQVLKKRTMFKLPTLLKLGCGPNVVDYQSLSPGDYAMRDGLWPQWRWALLNAGSIHHRHNGWMDEGLPSDSSANVFPCQPLVAS